MKAANYQWAEIKAATISELLVIHPWLAPLVCELLTYM